MSKTERRMAAVARFAEAQARARVPGSPILDRFVADRQAQRQSQSVQNAVPSSSITSDSEYYDWLVGGMASSGVAVTERTVMQVSAVYASVNLIAGAIASMPLPIYRRRDGNRERIDHDYWWMLNRQPTTEISAAVFWEYVITSLLLNGDGFARIIRPGRKSPGVVGLQPLHHTQVSVRRNEGRLWYLVTDRDTGRTETVDQDDMIHIPGPGFDGYNGKSQIKYALRNAAGIALAADQYSSAFFSNGARPDIALEMPGNPTPEQQQMMRSTWQERYQGPANAHKPALLAGGIKLHELTINAEDAQLISTRQFQVEDVARIFGVPPHMIGHTEKTTSWGSGVEAMGIGFVKYTLQRHLVKIEQELNRKLFRDRVTFCEFLTAGLERGDFKTRNDGYRVAIGRAGEPGWMTVNEIRKLENLPPVPDGDTLNTGANNANQPTA